MSKSQYLDPLGSICKLVTLNFKVLNTKISIQDNIINLQEPTGYQPLIRIYYYDSKENISILYTVILKVLDWYVLDEESDNNINIRGSPQIKKLLKYLCGALKKLQYTYNAGNVVFALQYYITIISLALEDPKKFRQDRKNLLPDINTDDNLLDYDKIKNLWSLDQLTRVVDLYEKCFEVESSNNCMNKEAIIKSYLKSINSILDIYDNNFQKLL
jgi:hypothetical protein